MEGRYHRRRTSSARAARPAKILLAVLVLLPALLGMLALVIDGNGMMGQAGALQHAADAAAQAVAMDLLKGGGAAVADTTASQYVANCHSSANTTVTLHVPPTSGAYVGDARFVEVVVAEPAATFFARTIGGFNAPTLTSRAVAGYQPTTAGAAIVVLDPSPAALNLPVTVPGLPALPTLPALIGGLEVLGLGNLQVQGAVLVNTTWGGVDQDGNPAGSGPGPPYGIACTPLLPATKLRATDIRVVGGVDNQTNYGSVVNGKPSPLQANKLPVADPWLNVPVPTLGDDPLNVNDNSYGGVQIALLPFQRRTLSPGVYDWIEIVAGQVTFSPGVYIIRSVNPLTQIAFSVLGGQITAADTMFYITDTATYSPNQGSPDATDGDGPPPAPGATALLPSAVINIGLPGSTFSAIASAQSPYYGMLLFQRRADRRPIIIIQQQILGGGSFSGAIYAKWGHVMLLAEGAFNASVTAGTMRVVTLLSCTITPNALLPPVEEVFLVE